MPTQASGTVLVTGGNSGIGFECARSLVGDGHAVLIASRDLQASQRAAERIRSETGRDGVEALSLDLGSLDAVRQFAKEIEARDLPIRTLVLNAGIQMTRHTPSADGYELTFAVNHLGHFLLTHLLLDRLRAHAPARIVVVSSGVHDPAKPTGLPDPDIGDMERLASHGGAATERYDGRLAYVNSKLCNLWFSYELARRIEAAGLSTSGQPLSVNAFEPGLVPGSGLVRDYPAPLRFVWDWLLPPLARVANIVTPMIGTAERSGRALAGVATDPALECVSGKYFPSHTRFREGDSSPQSHELEPARQLWEASVARAGLREGDSPLV